ncbi:MAG: polysaccharide biosynthesis protein [Lachnospiraceae bacterium]|nr:polysaccharide biosynthesis protein [Lachnospiraceae bacterium]
MSKNTILKGTLILTIAGLLTRVIGFFYKIFLSKALGAELLGIYQLVFPVYGVCFTVYASGIQTGISKMVAEEIGFGNYKGAKKVLWAGLSVSLTLACLLAVLMYQNAGFIAEKVLFEKDCASSLQILAIAFPFCGITACINGYYYGLKKAFIPATTQLVEQTIRVVAVYLIALKLGGGKVTATCELAVFGLVIGEIASNIYNIISLAFSKPEKEKNEDEVSSLSLSDKTTKEYYKGLGAISLPLTANRLLLSILHSFEAIMIPTMLKSSGLSNAEALSVYGILTGMTLPFLMFPSTLTNSLSVLLLPTISEANAKSNHSLIAKTVSITIKYSMILGIFSTGLFMAFGTDLGNAVFHEPRAGTYLMILSWLCPFLYMATTLSSIINGLGKAHLTFINSILGTSCRILIMIILIPKLGITGYLISQLVSQLLITFLDAFVVYKNVNAPFDAVNTILKPGIITACVSSFSYRFYLFLHAVTSFNNIILILGNCLFSAIIFLVLLSITKSIRYGEWKV